MENIAKNNLMSKRAESEDDKIDWNKIFDLDETLINGSQQRNEKEYFHRPTTTKQAKEGGDIGPNECFSDCSAFSDYADSGLFLSFDTDSFLELSGPQDLHEFDDLFFGSQAEANSSTENSPLSASLPVSPELLQVKIGHSAYPQIADENFTKSPEIRKNEGTSTATLYQHPSNIPNSVLALIANIKNQFTDHAVTYAMAAQMCQTVLPMDAYVSLKIALLLSLVSTQGPQDVPPISILAVGSDSSSIFKIMSVVGECAQKFIYPCNDLRNVKTKYNTNSASEINSLLCARKGVCYIGDWLGQQPAREHFIRKVLDSGRIPTENSSIGEPLQCSIWSYWSCYNSKMKKSINDLATFLSVFGIPITMEENDSDSIVDYLLEAAVEGHPPEPDKDLYIEVEDMKDFLYFIGNQSIEMSKEAEHLLSSYFLATRSWRPECLSQRAYSILRQFAESHARLCLRTVVQRNDAVASIVIAENFILRTFGSEMSAAPPRVSITKIEQVDQYMRTFETWLYSFIANHEDGQV